MSGARARSAMQIRSRLRCVGRRLRIERIAAHLRMPRRPARGFNGGAHVHEHALKWCAAAVFDPVRDACRQTRDLAGADDPRLVAAQENDGPTRDRDEHLFCRMGVDRLIGTRLQREKGDTD